MMVVPGQKGTAGIGEVPDPGMQDGALLVRGTAVGICGTDREIAEGTYDTPPSGEARLVIGRESLGEVLEAPAGSGFAPGDLVVGIVPRPDPVPGPACAAGEWDMCRTDSFGERTHRLVRLPRYGHRTLAAWSPDFARAHASRGWATSVLVLQSRRHLAVGPGGPDLAARILPARRSTQGPR